MEAWNQKDQTMKPMGYVKKVIQDFKKTYVLNKIVSVIFLLLLATAFFDGMRSLYRYYIKEMNMIALEKDVFVYDSSHLLPDSLRGDIVAVNQELGTLAQVTLVALPTLDGSYANRYANELLSTLETLYDSKKQIVVLFAEREKTTAVAFSKDLHTYMDLYELIALHDRSVMILKEQGVRESIQNILNTILFEVLPEGDKKTQLESYSLTTEELEKAEERSFFLEMAIKVLLIIVIVVLFVRLDGNKEEQATKRA